MSSGTMHDLQDLFLEAVEADCVTKEKCDHGTKTSSVLDLGPCLRQS
jgi:hypothetical protein